MKLVLFADGAVGHAIAQFLLDSHPEDVEAIVTTGANLIRELATKSDVPALIFDKQDPRAARQLARRCDIGVLAWWPWLLDEELLSGPSRGFINTHPSLLPFNRGKHYNFWALVEQAPFGVTLHKVDSGIDTGAVVAQRPIPYDWLDNGESLYKKAQNAMVDVFRESYPLIRSNAYEAITQDPTKGSFHRSSELDAASEIRLDAEYRARDLLNLLRARTFEGQPGCWFEDAGHKYEVTIHIRKSET